ncbi:type II secretion system F family protein [Phycisphaeraceae bacterium D3-23]
MHEQDPHQAKPNGAPHAHPGVTHEPASATHATPRPQAPHKRFSPPGVSPILLLVHLLNVSVMGIPAVVFIGLLVIGFGIVLGPFFSVLMLFALLMALVMLSAAVRRIKQERSATILGYLEVATRLNLPLPEFLDALWRGEGTAVGKRAAGMSHTLRMGGGLGEGLFLHVPELPAHRAAAVWRGEQAGRMREAVAYVVDATRRDHRETRSANTDAALQYALTVMIIMLGLMGLMSALIIPKYIEIFNDFETELPWLTRALFEQSSVFAPLLVLIASGALLVIVGWAVFGIFLSPEKVSGALRRIFEPVWWRVPVLSASGRYRALADACFLIEQAMRAGLPLPDAIELAAHPAGSVVLDARLRRFARGLRDGEPLPDAARAAKLPALVTGMLGTANAAQQPAETFAYLRRYYTHRVSPAEMLIRAAALPVMTLLAATGVALFVFALMLPLVALMETAIENTGYAG